MTGLRVGLESGRKKVFASALDWPGWCRSARTEEAALEALASCRERYFEALGETAPAETESPDVVERVEGNGTTDFGAPAIAFECEAAPMRSEESEHQLALLEGLWRYFDEVAATSPAVLRKGPRGGGRDRDPMVLHVLNAEVEYGRKVGCERWKPESASRDEIKARRTALLERLRLVAGPEPHEVKWPPAYAIRRTAWHVLDHAWEMEDRAL
ncbi:MAG: hypothetical protein ACRDZP_09140 [Acidimicrobiales bacterium]